MSVFVAITGVEPMTARCDLPPVRRDDVYAVPIRFWQDADKTVPFDLTAETFTAGLSSTSAGEAVQAFTLDDTDADIGVLVLSLDDDATGDLTENVWHWRLHAETADETWLAGVVLVSAPYASGAPGNASVDVVMGGDEIVDVSFAAGFVLVGAGIDGGSVSGSGPGVVDGGGV